MKTVCCTIMYPVTTHLLIIDFCKNYFYLLNHLPYLPDLASCDYSLFPKLKMKLKGSYFDILSMQTLLKHTLEANLQNKPEQPFKSLLNFVTSILKSVRLILNKKLKQIIIYCSYFILKTHS